MAYLTGGSWQSFNTGNITSVLLIGNSEVWWCQEIYPRVSQLTSGRSSYITENEIIGVQLYIPCAKQDLRPEPQEERVRR